MNNNASDTGGALQLTNATTIYRCSFVKNKSVHNGGGLFNSGRLVITNSVFGQNESTDPNYGGGGIFADSGTNNTITQSTFAYNKCGEDGGGGMDVYSTTLLVNAYSAFNIAQTRANNQSAYTGDLQHPFFITSITSQENDDSPPSLPQLYGGQLQTIVPPPNSGISDCVDLGGAITSLTAALAANSPTCSVGNASTIACTPGSYLIRIDSEQLLVTASDVVTNMLTITRGVNSTTPSARPSGFRLICEMLRATESTTSARWKCRATSFR